MWSRVSRRRKMGSAATSQLVRHLSTRTPMVRPNSSLCRRESGAPATGRVRRGTVRRRDGKLACSCRVNKKVCFAQFAIRCVRSRLQHTVCVLCTATSAGHSLGRCDVAELGLLALLALGVLVEDDDAGVGHRGTCCARATAPARTATYFFATCDEPEPVIVKQRRWTRSRLRGK